MSEEKKWKLVKIIQDFLSEIDDKTLITPQRIFQEVEELLSYRPALGDGIDRKAVVEELIRRNSIWIGDDSSLVNMDGHIPWLTSERKQDWRYWRRYREWQELKLPWKAIEGLDKATDRTLSMLEDPTREGNWDRRGMVVGHVQSGKTANYTGLICKAADAGYKIIIVLAGLHNNLRSQTQMRLDEGFLGYETTAEKKDGPKRLIGVGTIDSSHELRPQYVTNRSETGDFNLNFVRNLGVSPENKPWLFVVKKNKSILTRLRTWLHNHVARSTDPDTKLPLVTHLPLLIIDDEADHASVDTGEKVIGDDGKPDLEHEPTAINRLIRQILHSFSRKAYVGYTATPFANIYIHEHGETKKEGPDLFPAAFITNLSAPSNYIGPSRVFGLASENGREGALDLVRPVTDHCSNDGKEGWMPVKHKGDYQPSLPMPASLVEAIHSFILACAIRNLRGQGSQHCSMLVHVTRFNAVQQCVFNQIEDYISHLNQRLKRQIDHRGFLDELQQLWNRDFLPTTQRTAEQIPEEEIYRLTQNFEDIESQLPIILEQIDVRMINGTAKDALDYADNSSGLKVIAIGGDKLARGLTLEGLCVSYFLRASKMYDTLMQMGRWFGYRPAYLDLCRLYTTEDLVDWFEHIADAAEKLRSEFDYMTESGLTPRDYGLKVKSHPVLMVTSPLKMRTGRTLYLSFSGELVETVAFFKNKEKLQSNLSAFETFLSTLSTPQPIPDQARPGHTDKWNGLIWENVSAQPVIEFLRAYKTHPDSRKVRSDLLSDFIEKMSLSGELNSWTVAVIGGGVKTTQKVSGHSIKRMKRSNNALDSEDKYSIGRLLSPPDEAIDLDEGAWTAALLNTQSAWKPDPARKRERKYPEVPSGPYIRRIRGQGAEGIAAHPERGVLLLYILDLEASGIEGITTPAIGFGISFPASNSQKSIPYVVTNILWEQEYGGSE